MSQDFQVVSQTSAPEQEIADIIEGGPDDPCDCIGCRAPEVEYYYDDDEHIREPISLGELPPEWLGHLREHQCYSDDEIVEHVNEWYCRGDFPNRCVDLHGAVIINGVPGYTRHAATVRDIAAPWIEEHEDRYEAGGGRGTERLAEVMNWCRVNCRGSWVISSEEHVTDLYYVYVTFASNADVVAFENARARPLSKIPVMEMAR